MSKRVPQLGEAIAKVVGATAEFSVHGRFSKIERKKARYGRISTNGRCAVWLFV
jgi:hypothetical protein